MDIQIVTNGYPADVTKRLIDVDDTKMDAAQEILGTTTLKATVDAALQEVLDLAERRRALLADRGIDYSALADDDARRAAWG
jgi:Arc/MetJ family transcription regulator